MFHDIWAGVMSACLYNIVTRILRPWTDKAAAGARSSLKYLLTKPVMTRHVFVSVLTIGVLTGVSHWQGRSASHSWEPAGVAFFEDFDHGGEWEAYKPTGGTLTIEKDDNGGHGQVLRVSRDDWDGVTMAQWHPEPSMLRDKFLMLSADVLTQRVRVRADPDEAWKYGAKIRLKYFVQQDTVWEVANCIDPDATWHRRTATQDMSVPQGSWDDVRGNAHVFHVPPEAREFELSVGLEAASGVACFDNIQIIEVRKTH